MELAQNILNFQIISPKYLNSDLSCLSPPVIVQHLQYSSIIYFPFSFVMFYKKQTRVVQRIIAKFQDGAIKKNWKR